MTTSADRWATVERLYHAALTQPVGERAAFLADACAGDEELRREVESLLAQDPDAELTGGGVVAAAGLVSDVGQSALTGRRLGAYQILGPLGAGGMGEVYRARDTRLGRDVAIKILPRAFIADADRLARFEREARVLASLNHPHIAAIYGFEEGLPEGGPYGSSAPVRALILELVEGETLAERIARAGRPMRAGGPKGPLLRQGSEGERRGGHSGPPLPIKEALDIARQIADALDAAHEKGIVHRDLKPANIKITPQGVVKVLDFGLAKLEARTDSAEGVTEAPTITVNDTREGLIVGTAAYMSPEQARGQTVDKRTDIWAFGCVLYEMLTGRATFARETISDTIAAVLDREPNWKALSPATPANIQRLLARCLVKSPKDRLRDVGDALVEFDDALISGSATPLPLFDGASEVVRRWRFRALTAVGALGLMVSAFAITGIRALLTPGVLDTSAYRFVPFAAEPTDESSPSWSPDGKSVAYAADVDGVRQVFVRSLDSATPTQITKSSTDSLAPFWSPDGTRIYFASQNTRGGDLWSVGATGGEPELVVKEAGAATIAPDGKTLTFLRGAGGRRSLWTISTATGDPQQYRTPPFPETFARSDSVEFSHDGTKIGILVERQEGPSFNSELWVVPFPSGTPRRVLARARDVSGGRISWLPDHRHIVLDSVFLDRPGSHLNLADTQNGTIRPLTAGTVEEQSPSVSPAGDRIVFAAGGTDFDLIRIPIRGSDAETLLASARSETRPTWSPTGSQIAYVTNARGTPEIWVRNGEQGWARPIVKREPDGGGWSNLNRPSFSPDGLRIVYEIISARHAVAVSSVADGRIVPLDPESPDQHSPAWSPDGKWIAYQRLQGTNWELVKVPSGGGRPVRLAEAVPGGGDHTAWSPTGEWIAHVRGGALRLTSSDNGQAQRTFDGPSPAAFGFSLDGSILYAVRQTSGGLWELVEFDVQSGNARRATELHLPSRATLTGFSLHPNGTSFATAIGIRRHDIWLLEGFKPPSQRFSWF